MRLVLSTLLNVLLLLGIGLTLLVDEAMEDHARVSLPSPQSRQDLFRIQQLLAENDPRGLRRGSSRRLRLNEDELNLLANHFLSQYGAGAARLSLARGRVGVDMTLQLRDNPFGNFLNLTAVVRAQRTPGLLSLGLGPIEVPVWLAHRLGEFLVDRMHGVDGTRMLLDNIESMEANDQYLTVIYYWQPAMANALKRSLLGPEEIHRLRHYYAVLAEQTRRLQVQRTHSLIALLAPLLAEARARSIDGDPVAENRAALLVLAIYVGAYQIESLIGEAYAGDRPRGLRLVLLGQFDLAQHFAGSAALAAAGGSALSDAAGLYKEIRDSRGGSGFSFRDLAADRAGTRFGELATRSSASAHRLQDQVVAGIGEKTLMPAIGGLPNTMSARELERQVGGIDSPGFQRLQAEIERRIDALPLYAPAN